MSGDTTSIETIFDFKQNQVKNFVHDNLSSAPSTPVEGQEYFNTATKKKPYWNGSKWIIPVEIASSVEFESHSSDTAVSPYLLFEVLADYQDKLNYTPEDSENKTNTLNSSSTTTQYPNAKAVYDAISLLATLASPTFTGTPKAPTATQGDSSLQIANTAFVQTAISSAVTGGLLYKSSWDTTNASDYSALNSFRPIKKGWLFRVIGSGCTIDSVEYKEGDVIVFNRDVASSTAITTAMIDKYDHTQSDDTVLLAAVQSLTNKTIDAEQNTISNLALSMFASGVILTAMSANPQDTKLLTEKAIYNVLANYAKLASPTFTGTPKAPTATASTNNTQIATTAFVKTAVGSATSGMVKCETYPNPAITIDADGVGEWVVTHTLGTTNVHGHVYESSTGKEVVMTHKALSSTQYKVTLRSKSNVSANTYKLVLQG